MIRVWRKPWNMQKKPKFMGKTENTPQEMGSKHELTDTNPRSVVGFGVGLAVVIIVSLILMGALFSYFAGQPPADRRAVTPMEQLRELPPEPRLQVSERADLKTMRKQWEAQLNSYGWVDKKNGVVRIPIERAMTLLAERGWPAPSDKASKPAGAKAKGTKP